MIRRPPRSTRTDTLCPYKRLFRADDVAGIVAADAGVGRLAFRSFPDEARIAREALRLGVDQDAAGGGDRRQLGPERSEEHTSELQSLMRISYAVFCLKKTIGYAHE